MAQRNRQLERLVRQLTAALTDADVRYHGQFEGDDAAMRAYQQPQWERLIKRARKAVP